MAFMARIAATLLLVLILSFPTGCNTGGVRGKMPVEGAPAPDFTVADLSGNTMKLSDQRGKVVLLNFWGTWCPPCRDEAPSLARLNAAMSGKNFVMVAVALDKDGKKAVEAFFMKYGNQLPAYPDPAGDVARKYGIALVPETFIIDRQGVVRKVVHGPYDWDSPELIGLIDNLLKQ